MHFRWKFYILRDITLVLYSERVIICSSRDIKKGEWVWENNHGRTKIRLNGLTLRLSLLWKKRFWRLSQQTYQLISGRSSKMKSKVIRKKVENWPDAIKTLLHGQFKAFSEQVFGTFNYRGRNYPYKILDVMSVEEGQPLEVIDYEDGLVYVKVIEEINPEKLVYVTI